MNYKGIINSHPLVLVDFFAQWCGPCKMLSPTLLKIKEKLGDKIKVVKVDIDKNPAIAARHNIRSVPTMIIYKNGKPQRTIKGGLTQADLEYVLNFYL